MDGIYVIRKGKGRRAKEGRSWFPQGKRKLEELARNHHGQLELPERTDHRSAKEFQKLTTKVVELFELLLNVIKSFTLTI